MNQNIPLAQEVFWEEWHKCPRAQFSFLIPPPESPIFCEQLGGTAPSLGGGGAGGGKATSASTTPHSEDRFSGSAPGAAAGGAVSREGEEGNGANHVRGHNSAPQDISKHHNVTELDIVQQQQSLHFGGGVMPSYSPLFRKEPLLNLVKAPVVHAAATSGGQLGRSALAVELERHKRENALDITVYLHTSSLVSTFKIKASGNLSMVFRNIK